MNTRTKAVAVRVLARNLIHNVTVLAGTDLYQALLDLGIINKRVKLYHHETFIEPGTVIEADSYVSAVFPGDVLVNTRIGEFREFTRPSTVPHTTTIGALCRYTCVPYRNNMEILDESGEPLVDTHLVRSGQAYNMPIEAGKQYLFRYNPQSRPRSL